MSTRLLVVNINLYANNYINTIPWISCVYLLQHQESVDLQRTLEHVALEEVVEM